MERAADAQERAAAALERIAAAAGVASGATAGAAGDSGGAPPQPDLPVDDDAVSEEDMDEVLRRLESGQAV